MSEKILLSIINWNNSDLTNKCLDSVAKIPKNRQPDVILIDNNSTREPLVLDKKILAGLNSFQLIKNPRNEGFAGGHNMSLKMAAKKGYGFVCILNNDTEVLDINMFDELKKNLSSRNDAIAIAPTILSDTEPEAIWYAGGSLSVKRALTRHNFLDEELSQVKNLPVQETSFITGCCVLINMNKIKLEDVLFDDKYFVYFEDADWCASLGKKGYQLLWLPTSRLLHRTSSSLGARSPAYAYYITRNRILFGAKWRSSLLLPRILWNGFKIVGLAATNRSNVFGMFQAVAKGIRDGYKGRGGEANL